MAVKNIIAAPHISLPNLLFSAVFFYSCGFFCHLHVSKEPKLSKCRSPVVQGSNWPRRRRNPSKRQNPGRWWAWHDSMTQNLTYCRLLISYCNLISGCFIRTFELKRWKDSIWVSLFGSWELGCMRMPVGYLEVNETTRIWPPGHTWARYDAIYWMIDSCSILVPFPEVARRRSFPV